MNSFKVLSNYGQSVWLDGLWPDLLSKGRLRQLVQRDYITGIIAGADTLYTVLSTTDLYNSRLDKIMSENPQLDGFAVYEKIMIDDIRDAADILMPVYNASSFIDGYVSVDISPAVYNHSRAMIAEVRRLWEMLGLPNIMIRIPANRTGISVLPALIAEGINVNVTSVFSASQHDGAARAYIDGLRRCPRAVRVSSVVSFAVAVVDALLTAIDTDTVNQPHNSAQGQAAIAVCKLVYRHFQRLFHSGLFDELSRQGCRPQKVLWTDTNISKPNMSRNFYVENLIGPDSITAVSLGNMQSFKSFGVARPTLQKDVMQAETYLQSLKERGINFDLLADELQQQSITAYKKYFTRLRTAAYSKSRKLVA